jgi:hypothetical protein
MPDNQQFMPENSTKYILFVIKTLRMLPVISPSNVPRNKLGHSLTTDAVFQTIRLVFHNSSLWVLLGLISEKKLSIRCKVKVKCTLVQALRLCTGRTAPTGSRGIALLFHDYGTRRWWWVSVTLRLLFTPSTETVPIVQEAGWAPGPFWTGAEILAPTGIRFPDRQALSQSLYRLSYQAATHRGVEKWTLEWDVFRADW